MHDVEQELATHQQMLAVDSNMDEYNLDQDTQPVSPSEGSAHQGIGFSHTCHIFIYQPLLRAISLNCNTHLP